MSPVTLSSLLAIAAIGVSLAAAQATPSPAAPSPATPAPATPTAAAIVPLYSKHFATPADLPYKVDTDEGQIRGFQKGYNICNSTTENQKSLCQTAYFNNATDFCLWGPPDSGHDIGEIEGEVVAYCSRPGHGTRLIPAGALTGLQFRKTPDYIQIVGFIDQTQIGMNPEDYGGEMDPHGADLRGNPMGGVLFSDAFSTPGAYRQVPDWHNFMGGSAFCFKACDPAGPNAAKHCEHVYDRIGCTYNDPNNAKDGVFESCLADSADFPGIYTVGGAVQTYAQPPEALGPIQTVGYTPRVPASSSCVTLTSSIVFAGLPTGTKSATRSSSSGLSASKKTGSSTGSTSTPTTGSSTSDSMVLTVSGVSFLGVVFSALFLA